MSVPRGMWASLTNRRQGTPSRASYAQNVRFRYGTVRTRPGTSAVFSTTGKVPGLFNWITPWGANLVLYQDTLEIVSYNQATATKANLFAVPSNTRAPSFAPIDVWAYLCGFDTSGNGTFQTRIFDGTNIDKAFRGAPTITGWTAVDGGAGQCTQGIHFVGFVYQNRTGYNGIPVTGVVYAITATSNSAPDALTAPGNNLLVGQTVQISGSTGDTAINRTAAIVQSNPPGAAVGTPTGDSFTLTDTDGNAINGNGAYTGGASVTNPIQFTTQAGLRSVNISVSLPAQPDGGTSANGGVQATLFMIATATNNPNLWYFIPTDTQNGTVGEQPVPFNAPVTLNFVLSFSDFDINNGLAGDTAQANFLFLAQDASGAGPFNPNFVVAYGQRLAYGVGTICYVSDIGEPQQISADTNQVIMPNQRAIGAAFPLPGNTPLYVSGNGFTGYVVDNGDSPSTWGEPILVSDMLGTSYQNCVCFETGGPWVWVVTPGGPYLFDGAYENQPLTYLSSGYDEDGKAIGWTRVNCNAAYAIKIADDVEFFKLYIAVPLDGATEPNALFTIDYRMGKSFDSCDISLDVFGFNISGAFSSIAVIREFATGQNNLWIGPSTAGSIARFDVATHNDLGKAINGFWKSGLMKNPAIPTSMVRVGYLDLWMKGNSPLNAQGLSDFNLIVASLDGQLVVTPQIQINMGVPAALVDAPGQYYSAKTDLSKIPDYTVSVGTNAVDEWCEVSGITSYERVDLANR